MRITDQQLNFFHTFGFVVFRNYISRNSIRILSREFDMAMRELERAPPRSDLRSRRNRFFMDGDTPHITELADNAKFASVAYQLLKRRVICIHISGTRFCGETPWHSDNYALDYEGVKFLCYLDSLSPRNGALRIIPGSHRDPLWSKAGLTRRTQEVFGVNPPDLPSHVFDCEPGDILAFEHRLWHASFLGGDDRRMIEINYYADPVSKEEERAFRKQMTRNHCESANRNQQMYSTFWREIKNRQHQAWIKRLRELDVLETRRNYSE